jgi:hypothetical protein
MLYCGGGPSTGLGAILRGTRKGLEGLGGLTVLRPCSAEARKPTEAQIWQNTGATAYPWKARPPTAWVSWELGVSS